MKKEQKNSRIKGFYLLPLEEGSELFSAGRSWVNVLRGTKPLGGGGSFNKELDDEIPF